MAKTIKPVVIPTAEKLANFTRYGEKKRGEMLESMQTGKVIASSEGGDKVVSFGGVTVVLTFTGGSYIIVKVIGFNPEPKDPRPTWKVAFDRLVKDGYIPKRVVTTDGVLLELTDNVNKNLRVTIIG